MKSKPDSANHGGSSTFSSRKVALPTRTKASESARLRSRHLELLNREAGQQEVHEATTTPIFTMPVLEHAGRVFAKDAEQLFPQYGLLGGLSDVLIDDTVGEASKGRDPRVFFNIAAPSSTFICGSQGSGKSHTLSCLLENCLFPSDASKLPHPLTGLVFHYDTFISDDGGSPCEAAFLSSNPNITVRVLCSPTNVRTIKRAYHALNVHIEPLRINQSDLNTKRMLDLMAVSHDDGPVPLYMHTVYRILREMRIEQQERGSAFDYSTFKRRILAADLTLSQLGPLKQRLDTLESFMPQAQTGSNQTDEKAIWKGKEKKGKAKASERQGNDWTSVYMNTSAEASTFTNALLSTVRLQRHLGARIIISTQEPTISPALLDLSSVTIVHRFTSPEWLRSLKSHLAGVASDLVDEGDLDTAVSTKGKSTIAGKVFSARYLRNF